MAARAMQGAKRCRRSIASNRKLRKRQPIAAPEYVTVGSISVHPDRLPVDEDVVEGIVATIKAGNVNALPPIHVWRKQTGNVPILVAGRPRSQYRRPARSGPQRSVSGSCHVRPSAPGAASFLISKNA